MADFEGALQQLRYLWTLEARIQQERQDLMRQNLPRDMKEAQDRFLASQLEAREQNTADAFRRIFNIPPHHQRHDEKLREFHQIASFDVSVFVMTKFPATDPTEQTDLDRQLIRIIKAIQAAIRACHFEARLASDRHFHPMLWDNVELYLLGCKRGVAIVEDKYLPEFNPNVAMEWGWMRGMGREVLYLVEQDFQSERADTSGFLSERFSWNDPEADIDRAIKSWLNQ